MALYHKNLKYHEDEVIKRDLTKEEIDFLLELQQEMNMQDHVSQADPRFWVIKGTEKEYGIENGYEDGSELINGDGDTVAETLEEAMKYIEENIIEEVNERDGIERKLTLEKGIFNTEIEISWIDVDDDEEYTTTLEDMDDVKDWLENNGYKGYRYANYRNLEKIYPDTMFITQKAAENHLRSNHYHYSEDAHTYAMTSWRNYETSKLWSILQEVDWNKFND
jgi:hypothetical protein